MDWVLYLYYAVTFAPLVNFVLILFLCFKTFNQNRPIVVEQKQPGFYAKKIITKKISQ